jgi:hypothetical protein
VVELVNKLDFRELKQQLLPRLQRLCTSPPSPLNPLAVRVAALMCLAKIASVFDSDTLFGSSAQAAQAASAQGVGASMGGVVCGSLVRASLFDCPIFYFSCSLHQSPETPINHNHHIAI